ncbi:MAG: hypothetical protein HQ564_10560 [Candidatus Saganbacteria bacterium]|nr:hypothetical protein [Candidatus Saganbacteria bacterium]
MVPKIGRKISIDLGPAIKIKGVKLTSPLIPAGQVVSVIKKLTAQKTRVITVDFALGRFEQSLGKEGIQANTIHTLLRHNLDHHDGSNPGKSATEVAVEALLANPEWFSGDYAVISDQVIDVDNVCATFIALSAKLGFRLTEQDKALLTEASRYGDFIDRVSDRALKIALTIDAMRFGKNSFGKPFYLLTPEQTQELFNEIISQIPRMLTSLASFSELYQSEFDKLKSETERAIRDSLIKTIGDLVSLVDDPDLPQPVVYQIKDCAVTIRRKKEGKDRYTYNPIGLNSRMAEYDLSGLWEIFRELENEERERQDLPTLKAEESWGGREVAGGSPKGREIGSVLTLPQVTSTIETFIVKQIKERFEKLINDYGISPKDLTIYLHTYSSAFERMEASQAIIKILHPATGERIIKKIHDDTYAWVRGRWGGGPVDHWEFLGDYEMALSQAATRLYWKAVTIHRPNRLGLQG